MTKEHFILERVAKGLCVRSELETEQTATYWPQVPLSLAALFFSFCWAAQPRVTEDRKPSVWSWFSLPRTATGTPTATDFNWLHLTQTVCGTGLYNYLTPTCFLWASQLNRIQPVHRSRWYPDVFDRMHLLFIQVHLLIDCSIEAQYVTLAAGDVKIQRGFFQRDSLSLLLFVIAITCLRSARGDTNLQNHKKKLIFLCIWMISRYLQKMKKNWRTWYKQYKNGIWHWKMCHADNEKW